MNYTKFLGRKEAVVLAYLGGPHAYGKDRRLRVDLPRPAPGFHRFEVMGRSARAVAPVESPELGALPRARGHHVRGWLVASTRDAFRTASAVERVQLMPTEEPAPFAILRGRRWHSGDLVFESLDFDGDAEEAARLRLEKLQPLGDLRAVAPSLRLAYGIALVIAVAGRMQIPLSIREAARAGPASAEGGEPAATTFLEALSFRRAEDADRARIRAIVRGQRPADPVNAYPVSPRDNPTLDNAHLRAELALDDAHARMLSSRSLGGGNLEVTFELMGERFISVVDAITLHVYDSGVCLAGADELVTLDSLPGVIREAIETDALVITRR
jgi:hypothetical protein